MIYSAKFPRNDVLSIIRINFTPYLFDCQDVIEKIFSISDVGCACLDTASVLEMLLLPLNPVMGGRDVAILPAKPSEPG